MEIYSKAPTGLNPVRIMRNSQRSILEYSQTSQKTLSHDQIEAAILKVTSYLLCEMRSLRKIRKEDVVTNALNGSTKQYTAIMKRVKENLLNIFGFHIATLINKEDTFIIINKHSKEFLELTSESASDEEIQDNLILTIILAAIFLNRGQMFESHLLTLLDHVGFFGEEFYASSSSLSEHKIKDHVTKLLKQVFVKHMYLESTAIDRPEQAQNPPLPENDRKVNVYQWGYRALLEVDVDKIVEYLVKIHDGEKPSAFPTTYYKELKAKQEFLRSRLN